MLSYKNAPNGLRLLPYYYSCDDAQIRLALQIIVQKGGLFEGLSLFEVCVNMFLRRSRYTASRGM